MTGRWRQRGDRPYTHPDRCACGQCVVFLYAVPDHNETTGPAPWSPAVSAHKYLAGDGSDYPPRGGAA